MSLKKTSKRRRALGQHFLIDENILRYEATMARIDNMKVLEIGGGKGNLTVMLAEHAKHLIVVEKDKQLAAYLRIKCATDKKIKIIEEDFLRLDPNDFNVDIIIGNIPYSISSQIIFKLRQWKFNHALLCLQKEFAERMTAKPGDKNYSRLSVMTQIYFKIIFLRTVSRTCFEPVPDVDSAIVLLTKKDEKINEERDVFIERLFSHGKNTLHAALKAKEMQENYPNASDIAKNLGLEKRRVRTLSIEELNTLFENISGQKIDRHKTLSEVYHQHTNN